MLSLYLLLGFLSFESSITRANWKSKVKIAVGNKMIAGVGFEPNHVWAPCCKTWLWGKMEGKFAIAKKRREKNEVRDFYLLGSYPLVGRHVD